jgi:hypothetical protein
VSNLILKFKNTPYDLGDTVYDLNQLDQDSSGYTIIRITMRIKKHVTYTAYKLKSLTEPNLVITVSSKELKTNYILKGRKF